MSNSADLSKTTREHTQELGEQAKVAASREAEARADQAKDIAAAHVEKTSNVASAAQDELEPASMQAQALQQVADQISDVAEKLRTADVDQLSGTASDVARRNPMLMLGGAALAGFAIARFFKARDPGTIAWDINDNPWSPRHSGNTADDAVISESSGEKTDA